MLRALLAHNRERRYPGANGGGGSNEQGAHFAQGRNFVSKRFLARFYNSRKRGQTSLPALPTFGERATAQRFCLTFSHIAVIIHTTAMRFCSSTRNHCPCFKALINLGALRDMKQKRLANQQVFFLFSALSRNYTKPVLFCIIRSIS